MKNYARNIFVFQFTILLVPFVSLFAALQFEYSYSIPKTSEQELNVRIESSLNKIVITRGDHKNSFSIFYNNVTQEHPKAKVTYKVINHIGYLSFKTDKEDYEDNQLWEERYNNNSYYKPEVFYISLNNSIPLNFDFKLGAGYSKFDMSGLMIKNVKIETGAAETIIICNEENPIVLETIKIDAGLSKLKAYKLGNANFKKLYFEGGVGSYFFDFNGSLRQDSFVSMELGLGSLSMIIPEYVGTTINYNKGFLSSHNFEDFRDIGNGKFISNNYNETNRKINISIESGLGNVKIKRSK